MTTGAGKPITPELDHILVCVSPGAPEAACLASLGLTEGTPNTHPGQGTACRRFVFENSYLELLWVHDAAEARSDLVRPTRLWDRWSGRNGSFCSIGFCFRPATPATADVPFEAWEYRPSYLPEPLCIHVAANVDVLTEPMLCYLSFAKRQRLEHASGLPKITRTEFVSPHGDRASPILRSLGAVGSIRLRSGPQYAVELGFDGETEGRKAHCGPELPLVLSW
jgi:hypothetical protein